MRIIARKTLRTFWAKHANAEEPLKAWFSEAKAAKWISFQEIKHSFPSADVRPKNRVIFNIKGNTYRMVVKIHYNTGFVFIRFIGTHAQYDRIDPDTI